MMLFRTTALPIAALWVTFILAQGPTSAPSPVPPDLKASVAALEEELAAKYGEGQRPRLRQGLRQAAGFWRAEDGGPKVFEDVARTHFAGDQKTLDALFDRMEFVLESFNGHMAEIGRDLRWQMDLDLGPLYPFDEILGGYDPSAHFLDDAFANKLAFAVLLNFPRSTLEERLKEGASWTRRGWAEARLADMFGRRVPAEVSQAISEAGSAADRYVASYNIWMHHLLDGEGRRLFPPKLRLLSHWNLRDELKSQYAAGAEGLGRQRMIQKVMERIVTQTIPAAVVDNPNVDWDPFTNDVKPAAVKDADRPAPPGLAVSPDREPDTRYRILLDCYRAVRRMDPHSPLTPTHIARSFEEGRQMPEARVRRMLEEICGSTLVPRVARLIESRLGRKLEPFDIWYSGFRAGSSLDERKLDKIIRERYPDAAAYKKDMPNLLRSLGFSPDRADWLAGHIEVDPSRGSGHAMGASRRGVAARLRTRVGKDGMDYKGFNIAIHEMGHNVEQTFSLNNADHWLLNGVPNTSFTEAMAFVFQANDLKLLGQAAPDSKARAERVLNDFWGTYEIAGVSLVDMGIWHWMYDHPDAAPAELRDAMLGIAREVWNRYYAPVFGQKDTVLLAIYSHIIHSFLYVPDYAMGHCIAFQIERRIEKSGKLGEEIERMATIGNIAPDLWMMQATGKPVGPEALLDAVSEALGEIGKSGGPSLTPVAAQSGKALPGSWPQEYTVARDDASGFLTLTTPYYAVAHDLKRGGAIARIGYKYGKAPNLLVSPIGTSVRDEKGVLFTDLKDSGPQVTSGREGSSEIVTVESGLLDEGGRPSGIRVKSRYEYRWGYIKIRREFLFPAEPFRARELCPFSAILAPSLTDFGYREGLTEEEGAPPFSFGSNRWGKTKAPPAPEPLLKTPHVPRSMVFADAGIEGLEWFVSSDLSQWDLQLTGRRGQGQCLLGSSQRPPGLALSISPLYLADGAAPLKGASAFDSYLGMPILEGHAWKPWFHTSFNRNKGDWVSPEQVRRWAESGIQTVHCHNDGDYYDDGLFWRDGSYPPYPDMDRYDKVIADCHASGIRAATYFSNKELHPSTKEYQEHGQEWGRKDRKGNLQHNFYRPQSEFGAQMCLRSGWLDFLKSSIDRVLKNHPLDGVYYDWNVALWCANALHEGKAAGSAPAGHWDIDELLDLMEWTRRRVGPGGLIIVHNTTTPMFVTENFADYVVAMEWGYKSWSEGGPELRDLPLEWTFAGARPRGVISYGHIDGKAPRRLHRLFALEALLGGATPWPASPETFELYPLLKPLGDIETYRFLDWRNQAVALQGGRFASALYSRPGEAYIVLANLEGEPKSITCTLRPESLPHPLTSLTGAVLMGAAPSALDASGLIREGVKIALPADGAVLIHLTGPR